MYKFFSKCLLYRQKVAYYTIYMGFTLLVFFHFHLLYKWSRNSLNKACDRVREGRDFDDGIDRRKKLMSLTMKNIKKSNGIFIMARNIKDQNIGEYADIGFLTFFHYPIPVHYLNEDDLKKCDHFIANNGFIYKMFLKRNGEKENFKELDSNHDFIVMKRTMQAWIKRNH